MKIFRMLNGLIDRVLVPIEKDQAIGILRKNFIAGYMSHKQYLSLKIIVEECE